MGIYFITGNKNKFNEAKEILPILEQYDIDLDEIQETNPKKIIEHKLKEALNQKKACFIVEDASLYLDCLGKLPGPLIKWFWKELGNSGLYELCKRFNNFKGTAAVTVGYYDGGQIKYFEGMLSGKIVKPVSSDGFGYDPIFQPKNCKKTYHEMTLQEKNKISHRRKALDKLKKYLMKNNLY